MKQILNFFYWILLVTIVLSGCSKEEEVHEVISEPKTILNAAYGDDAAQKADIYLPAGRSQLTTKVLLVIHGGGWMSGDKKDMESFVPKFQSQFKDYAIVNMNYRLVNLSRYMLPTQTDDIRSVMDYVSKNASEFGVKPEFIVLGVSAGGHLAMLYAYKYDSERRVKCVVNIVGPSDLSDSTYTNDFMYSLAMGYITASENLPSGMPLSVFGSPVTWITNDSPPTISFYGRADDLIPHSQHTTLEQKLNQFKVPNEKYVYEGGHDVGAKQSDDIVNKTLKFISTYVR